MFDRSGCDRGRRLGRYGSRATTNQTMISARPQAAPAAKTHLTRGCPLSRAVTATIPVATTTVKDSTGTARSVGSAVRASGGRWCSGDSPSHHSPSLTIGGAFP